jgi:uncharacterized membrane protein
MSPSRAVGRLLLSSAVGLGAVLLTPGSAAWTLRAVVGWSGMSTALLVQSWIILARSNAKTTQLRASDEDPGGTAAFVIAVLSSLFSLFAAALVLHQVRGQPDPSPWLAVALLSVALSWLLTHTMYTFRYAHLYYRGGAKGGLAFPGTDQPNDLDFAYYAFTIGMCFQVSDVQITSSKIRGPSLAHALISFVFNTTILALTVNVISQLLG